MLKIYFWNNQLLLSGTDFSKKHHYHYLLQIIISPDSIIEAKRKDGTSVFANAILINSNIVHCCKIKGYTLSIFIEPEGYVGRKLQILFNKDNIISLQSVISEEIIEQVKNFSQNENPNDAKNLFKKIIDFFTGSNQQCINLDERIKTIIEYIPKVPDKKISVMQLAAYVNLSESRLMHLFNENMGIPIRRYLLWKRLIDAILMIRAGESFTMAAVEAGFTDYAHLSKTFKNNFGSNLKQIFKDSRFIHVWVSQS